MTCCFTTKICFQDISTISFNAPHHHVIIWFFDIKYFYWRSIQFSCNDWGSFALYVRNDAVHFGWTRLVAPLNSFFNDFSSYLGVGSFFFWVWFFMDERGSYVIKISLKRPQMHVIKLWDKIPIYLQKFHVNYILTTA